MKDNVEIKASTEMKDNAEMAAYCGLLKKECLHRLSRGGD